VKPLYQKQVCGRKSSCSFSQKKFLDGKFIAAFLYCGKHIAEKSAIYFLCDRNFGDKEISTEKEIS